MTREFTRITQPTFDLHAVVSPDGGVERTNIYTRKTFKILTDQFSVKDTRLLVVSKTGQQGIYMIDLWSTTVTDTFPYQEPWYVMDELKIETDLVFDTVDHAVAWAAMNINDLPKRL